jgi:hypothetical protein
MIKVITISEDLWIIRDMAVIRNYGTAQYISAPG